jgi:hypothetical protein
MPSRQWFESGGRRHRALEHRLPGANGYRDPPNRPDRRLSLFPSMLSIELFSEGIEARVEERLKFVDPAQDLA